MALNVEKGVISSPASTGNQTYNLPNLFDPKAVIVWWTGQTAEGIVDDAQLAIGAATDRGGTAANESIGVNSNDAAVAGDCGSYTSFSTLCRLYGAGGSTITAEVDFVEFTNGSPATMVFSWVTIPTTGTKLHYLVLGGSDITDALVGNFALAASTPQDVTVTAGFGQPDLLMFLSPQLDGTNFASTTSSQFMVGWAKDETEGRCACWNEDEGSATIDVGYWTKGRAILMLDVAANTAYAEAELDVRSSWPTDGFRLAIADLPGIATLDVRYLALKGTFQSKVVQKTSTPTGAPPQTDSLGGGAGFAPKAVIVWGGNLDNKATIDTTHADLGQFFFGAADGTNEGWAGMSQEDNAADADTYSYHSESKLLQMHAADTSAILLEADSSFGATAVDLNFTDTDATARAYNFLVLGDAPAAAEALPKPPTLVLQGVNRAGSF